MSESMLLERQATAVAVPEPVTRLGTGDPLVFDREWYRATYPDAAPDGSDPLQHYLSRGAAEGRNPNRSFDTGWYLEQNPDVRTAGINPFLHFVMYGHREGRAPSSLSPRPTRSLRMLRTPSR